MNSHTIEQFRELRKSFNSKVIENIIIGCEKYSHDIELYPGQIREAIECLVEYGIGFTIGTFEQNMDCDFSLKSKEYKLLRKMIDYSYNDFHRLDQDFNYVYPENEFI